MHWKCYSSEGYQNNKEITKVMQGNIPTMSGSTLKVPYSVTFPQNKIKQRKEQQIVKGWGDSSEAYSTISSPSVSSMAL
jgi:hypothetical protein